MSAHLENALRELARQHGIVMWLDKEAAYEGFVARLRARADSGAFPYPVRAYRGSYLETLIDLDGLEEGVDATPMIMHVPRHNALEMASTPLLELYTAGWTHLRALPTLIKEAAHGRATAQQIDALLAREGLTLEAADAWLTGLADGEHKAVGPDLSALNAEALFDAIVGHGELAQRLDDMGVVGAVIARAGRLLGMPEDFAAGFHTSGTHDRDGKPQIDLEPALAAWAMCVELVHDLARPPKDALLVPLRDLPKPMIQASQRLAQHLRERHPERYKSLAEDTERRLEREVRESSAEDLGQVDTFRFEDRKVLAAALDALRDAKYQTAHTWAQRRFEGGSFWTQREPERKRAWELTQLAAALGIAIEEHKDLLAGVRTHGEAVDRYTTRGHQVDCAQRKLEQARQQASVLAIEEFPILRARLDALRVTYRQWADAQARAWNALCRTQGFLPTAALRQRELFEDVVRPAAAEDGVTAFFMVDALRFEMAAELERAISSTSVGGGSGSRVGAARVQLDARLAELPTVTEVGMNVLAPLAVAGKLRPDITDRGIAGFRSQEARVASPEDRRKVMHDRVGGRTCTKLSLEEVIARDSGSIRRAIAESKLVVIHCEGIDKAGEKGVGLIVFEQELLNLRAAYRVLLEAGVRRFVFTADHGFLLHDPVSRAPRSHGNKVTPKRRHVLSDKQVEQSGEVCVSAAALDYDLPDTWFLFPEDAAPFDTGEKAKDFVHGGNSLQERVIPVLTVTHRNAPGSESIAYRIEASGAQPVARMSCIHAKVLAADQTGLTFGSAPMLELILECVDSRDARVELCDARDAEVRGNAVLVRVDQPFELFFRIHGSSEERVRVRMRHVTSAQHVAPVDLLERFAVELFVSDRPPAMRASTPGAEPTARASKPASSNDESWLSDLPEGGVRDVFRYLALNGLISEADATRMLGGARQFRAFSRQVDEYRKRLPFELRIEVSSGTKHYVRG